ncbi:MAG: Hsp20/alpha crystallin family protein [Saprospiraceae bacterium]
MTTKDLSRNSQALPSVLENFLRPWTDWTSFRDFDISPLTVPAVNVVENHKNFEMTLAAPGMEKNDFKIELDSNVLTISSEKEDIVEDKGDRYSRKEYNYASFRRSFTLPESVSKDKIDAKYENGILKVKLHKKEDAIKATVTKAIEVK